MNASNIYWNDIDKKNSTGKILSLFLEIFSHVHAVRRNC